MNASDFWKYSTDPFGVSRHEVDKRSVVEHQELHSNGKFQKSSAQAEIIEDDSFQKDTESEEKSNHFASMRWLVYKALAKILEM